MFHESVCAESTRDAFAYLCTVFPLFPALLTQGGEGARRPRSCALAPLGERAGERGNTVHKYANASRVELAQTLSWNIILAADLFGSGATARSESSDLHAAPLCSLRDSAVSLILGGCQAANFRAGAHTYFGQSDAFGPNPLGSPSTVKFHVAGANTSSPVDCHYSQQRAIAAGSPGLFGIQNPAGVPIFPGALCPNGGGSGFVPGSTQAAKSGIVPAGDIA